MDREYIILGGSGYFGSNFIYNLLKDGLNNKIIINIDIAKSGNRRLKRVKNYYYLQYNLANSNNVDRIARRITDIEAQALRHSLNDERDIFNKPGCTYTLNEKQILPKRILINFAAQSFVDTSISSPVQTLENNVEIVLNMLKLTKKIKFDEIIHISTDEVHILNKKDIRDVSAYALSKKICEDILLKVSSNNVFKIVRPVNLYGVIDKDEKCGLWQKNKCIITKLIDAYKHPDIDYELYLSESTRHFINIQRACDTLMKIVNDDIDETRVYLMKYDFHMVIKDLILNCIDRYSLNNISIIDDNSRGRYEDDGYGIPEMKKYDKFEIDDFWKMMDWMLDFNVKTNEIK